MKKAIALQIAQPCNEYWESMDNHDLGKFCQICKTEVFDFTDLTDAEILQVLKHAPQKVCGKFRASQLNRPLSIDQNVQKSRNPRFSRMLAATVLLAVSTPFLKAQDTIPALVPIEIAPNALPLEHFFDVGIRDPMIEKLTIRGSIYYEYDNQEPAIGIYIAVKGTNIEILSDIDGEFEIKLPKSYDDLKSVQLEFSSVGLETEMVTVDMPQKDKLKVFMREAVNVLLGEVIIIRNDYYDPIYGR